jgi:hypothetical protein
VIVTGAERVTAEAPAPPDADFARLSDVALAAVRARTDPATPGSWTDHNAHDPGITLLEAVLWAVADAHYRAGERGSRVDGWAAEAKPWRPASVPRGRAAREEVAAQLRAHGDKLRATVARSGSRAQAVERLAADLQLHIDPVHTGPALVALLREPVLLRAALDGTAGDVWPDEAAYLLERSRQRFLAELLTERGDEIRRVAAGPAPIAALQQQPDYALSADEAAVAAAAHPCPRVEPRTWEGAHGATELWPPHALQARTCEPVTGDDYRRLVAAVPDVARAWVVPGSAAGIDWQGKPRNVPAPGRRGGITLLVEPARPMDDVNAFLRACLSSALRSAGEVCEPDTFGDSALKPEDFACEPAPPTGSHRIGAALDLRLQEGWLSPRRLLGDEVGAALIGDCGVVVKGVLHVDASAPAADVLADARRLLDEFLSLDRKHPAEPDPPAPAPLRCPDELGGPWPAPPADPDAPWPAVPPPTTGWPPGGAVRVSELVQVLETLPEVVGVDGLEVRLEKHEEWEKETLAIDPFCVPALAGECLLPHALQPRTCDG